MTVEQIGRSHPRDRTDVGTARVDAGSGRGHGAPGAGPLVQPLTRRDETVGFVVTRDAFEQSMAAAGRAGVLAAIRAEAAAADGAVRERLHRAAAGLVRHSGPSAELAAAVADLYPALGIEDFGPARVVVRAVDEPSGAVEPVPVRGLAAVLTAVVDSWADSAGAGAGGTAVIVHVAPPARSTLRDRR